MQILINILKTLLLVATLAMVGTIFLPWLDVDQSRYSETTVSDLSLESAIEIIEKESEVSFPLDFIELQRYDNEVVKNLNSEEKSEVGFLRRGQIFWILLLLGLVLIALAVLNQWTNLRIVPAFLVFGIMLFMALIAVYIPVFRNEFNSTLDVRALDFQYTLFVMPALGVLGILLALTEMFLIGRKKRKEKIAAEEG